MSYSAFSSSSCIWLGLSLRLGYTARLQLNWFNIGKIDIAELRLFESLPFARYYFCVIMLRSVSSFLSLLMYALRFLLILRDRNGIRITHPWTTDPRTTRPPGQMPSPTRTTRPPGQFAR